MRRIGKSRVELETESTAETLKVWPHAFRLRAVVSIAGMNSLNIAVTETNTGAEPYESAFGVHPYFAVSDACKVFLDGAPLPRPWVQTEFAADGKPHLLEDRVGKRTFTVSTSSGDTWCVWNPGVERTPLCDTLSPDEWQRLYCLEPFMRQPITLAPGESREHVVRIAVSGL